MHTVQVDESLGPVEAVLTYSRSDFAAQRHAYLRVSQLILHHSRHKQWAEHHLSLGFQGMAAAIQHCQDPSQGLHQMLELAQELLGAWGTPAAPLQYPTSLTLLLQQVALLLLGGWARE
jgi:hypothetical protein